MKKNVKMYIGFDSSQALAYDTCRLSIQDYSAVDIHPVSQPILKNAGYFWRDDHGSTEFAFTRFLAPYLKGYYGYAIFCDSDFIWNCDPTEILDLVDPNHAVSVVKHSIQQSQIKPTKMDNKNQSWYPRKNWSSLMVFNCGHPFCKKITPAIVSESPAGYLHEFTWCSNDSIGSIPHTYNYLVGYYNDIKEPKAIHYTDGGPWHSGYENVEFADKWLFYKQKVIEIYGRE